MTKPTITIHDISTGEVIERPMNANELEQYKIDQADSKLKISTEAEKLAAREALLARLNISEAEATLLLG